MERQDEGGRDCEEDWRDMQVRKEIWRDGKETRRKEGETGRNEGATGKRERQ